MRWCSRCACTSHLISSKARSHEESAATFENDSDASWQSEDSTTSDDKSGLVEEGCKNAVRPYVSRAALQRKRQRTKKAVADDHVPNLDIGPNHEKHSPSLISVGESSDEEGALRLFLPLMPSVRVLDPIPSASLRHCAAPHEPHDHPVNRRLQRLLAIYRQMDTKLRIIENSEGQRAWTSDAPEALDIDGLADHIVGSRGREGRLLDDAELSPSRPPLRHGRREPGKVDRGRPSRL